MNYRVAPAGPNSAATYATLREIEGRLKSIKNIQKITSTMKIVASTKLTRATRTMNDSRVYGETSNEVFKQAETAALEEGEKKTLVIVCSSDKGLCGGIHSSMSRFIRRLQAEGEKFDLAIIGEKCRSQLSRTSAQDIQLSFAGVGKAIPTYADAQAIADQVIMLPKEYTDVKILYNRFINATSYEPTFIEAFSEEAILASRMCLFTMRTQKEIPEANLDASQHFFLRGRRFGPREPPRVQPCQLPLLGSG